MSARTVPGYAHGWTVPGFSEQRELGGGATGRVVEAVHDRSGHRVAIKYLSPALIGDPVFLRFRAEARALRELRVPQVVPVYDFVEEPGHGAAIITELVNGVSLRALIERHGPVSPEAALSVLKGTLLALGAAHALGIGHRDCQPGNVLADAAGNSRLTGFGWTARPGERLPPYLAPELWRGVGESPATDLYAATAVFFYCLAGEPPFTGTAAQLRDQHATAAVPAERVDPPLRRLVARGMAKDPARRPHSAVAFAAELEALADSAYGHGWEERGRGQLAERVSAVLPLPPGAGRAGARGRSPSSASAGDGGKRLLVAIAAGAAAAVVAIGGVAAAVTLKHKDTGHAPASLSATSSQGMPGPSSFSAVADVTPPVAAAKCTAPATFTYSGTLTAPGPGNVTFRWVYSSGKPGPEQTVKFTTAGERRITGETVSTKTAGGGWGKVELVSPVALTSNEAAYKLLCGGGSVGGVTVTAAVAPAARTVSCVTAPPAFTATGSITTVKAEKVTYYWARSDGANSAPDTLTFTGPGTQAVPPLTISSPGASGSGSAVLVVTSPVTTASSPAMYTLTCQSPSARPTTSQTAPPTATRTAAPAASAGRTSSSADSPSSSPPVTATGSATAGVAPASLTLTVNAPKTATLGQPYSGTVTATGGDGNYTWGDVTLLPPGVTAAGNGATLTISGTPSLAETVTVTGQVSDGESPPQTLGFAFNLTVSQPPITLTGDLPATATVGQPYTGTVTMTGGMAGSLVAWTVNGLPPGLKAVFTEGTTLTISGTPTSVNNPGSSIFVVASTGAVTGNASFPIQVGPAS